MRLVFAMEAREGQNAQDKAERLMAATGHHLEDVIALIRQRNKSAPCWPWNHSLRPSTQGKAEHLTAATGTLSSKFSHFGIAGQVVPSESS